MFEIPSKFFHSKSRPAAKVLVLKCTEDITTLGDTKRIRDSFADVLGLQSSALQLESIKEGCVELHFIISPAIADHIVPLFSSKESYFKEIGISAISINSQTQTDENNFRKFLEVFSSLSGVDMKYITQKFEADLQNTQGPSTQRRSSLNSQISAKKKQAIIAAGTLAKSGPRKKANTFPHSVPHSVQPRSKSFDIGVKCGAVLEPIPEPIPGSPSAKSKKALKEPELDLSEQPKP